MKTVIFKVEGMHCDGCATLIQSALERSTGVAKASASFKDGQARVLFDPLAVTEEQLIEIVEKGGYRVATRSWD